MIASIDQSADQPVSPADTAVVPSSVQSDVGHVEPAAPFWLRSNLIAGITSIVAGVSAFASTWFLLSPAVETTDRTILIGLVVGNVFVAGILIILVGSRIWHVWSGRRNRLAGSRMHMQLVWLFSLVSVVPAAVAFLFAFSILRTSLNDVFSERIDNYQGAARDIANGLVESKFGQMQLYMLNTAKDISRNEQAGFGLEGTPISFRQYLETQRNARNFSAMLVLDGNYNVITRIDHPEKIYGDPFKLPEKSSFDLVDQFPAGVEQNFGVNSEAFRFGANDTDTFDHWRGIMKLPVYDGGYLVAYSQIDPRVSQRLVGVRRLSEDWQEAVRGRQRLERVFVAGYIVLGLIILFGAIWAALAAATRIVGPIGRLVGMADRVSAGDLNARVNVHHHDGEVGELAKSMNHMTAQLQNQRNDLIETNRRFDRRRRFTEAVLSGVSAGVVGVGGDGRITIANSSAADFLGIKPTRMIGEMLVDLVPELADLFGEAQRSVQNELGDQVEFHRNGHTATLNVRIVQDIAYEGHSSADHNNANGQVSKQGDRTFVVTFDDISQLITAQRNAAWGDVARRIAHEIKNPLTPIQLSAERLRRKYLNEITTTPEVFDKCTDTIIRQVNDIGRMVDEFSSFARMPKPVIDTEDLRELAKSALFPQRVTFPDIQFEIDFPDHPVCVECDGRLIVQALTNLIKNAAESVTARIGDDTDPAIAGRISLQMTDADQIINLHIIDNGIGLPKTDRHRLVEPYMTTRAKGTGLGLAIVKKVAEDHGGALSFNDDNSLGDTGARITLCLPLVLQDEAALSDKGHDASHQGANNTVKQVPTITAAE